MINQAPDVFVQFPSGRVSKGDAKYQFDSEARTDTKNSVSFVWSTRFT